MMKTFIFENPDKEFTEKQDEENYMNVAHPFQMLIVALPSSGKSSLIMNLLYNKMPIFERIYLYHLDSMTKEYDIIDHVKITFMPSFSDFDRNIKNLIIIEDIDFKRLKKEEKENLDRLVAYGSSHHNISIIYTAQQIYALPPSIRRMNNVLIIFKLPKDSYMALLNKLGLTKYDVERINQNLRSKHDYIRFDTRLRGTPNFCLLNMTTQLNIE